MRRDETPKPKFPIVQTGARNFFLDFSIRKDGGIKKKFEALYIENFFERKSLSVVYLYFLLYISTERVVPPSDLKSCLSRTKIL